MELLESRLVPSALSGPYPEAPGAAPPAATASHVSTTAGALTPTALAVLGGIAGGVTGTAQGQGLVLSAPAQISVGAKQNVPGSGAASALGVNGDYAVTWQSDAQDGTACNGYIPLPDGPVGPQGGTLPVTTAPAGGQTGAPAPGTADNFTITWSVGSTSGFSATRS